MSSRLRTIASKPGEPPTRTGVDAARFVVVDPTTLDEPHGPVVTATSLRDKCKGREYDMDAAVSRRFTCTRYRAGYLTADVDAFIDRIEATLGLRPPSTPPVTAADVAAAQFRVVRLRAGYEMREVDDALDRYEARLSEAELQ